MKSTLMTLFLLTAVATVGVQAQSGGNSTDGQATPAAAARGVSTSKTSHQSGGSAKKSGSTMGTGSTRLKPAVGNTDDQSSASNSGQSSKGQGKRVNQRAAGVPPHTGSSGHNSGKPATNQ